MVTLFATTIATIIFSAALCGTQPSSKDDEMRSLQEHVKKMDAVLQEVQSHAQAQEQKYSAVLSSVLSQLTQTTEELQELSASKNTTEELRHELQELSASKNVTEELQLKVENLEDELRIVKETNNNTLLDYQKAMDELVELKQSHNETKLQLTELETVKKEVNSLQQDFQNCRVDSSLHGPLQLNLTSSNQAWQQRDIGFEASLTQTLNVSPSDRIVFDKVTHNEGCGYNNNDGYFTVPESGTYLCWTNIVYASNAVAVTFRIQAMGKRLGTAYGNANEAYGAASVTTISYLNKGDRVGISPSKTISVYGSYSSAGAVLIKQH